MSKLLTDEEMKAKIHDITQNMLVALSEWQAGAPIDYHSIKEKGRSDLFQLFSEQKRAHGDMVIGEDQSAYSEDGSRYFEHVFHQNNLRVEQRERNAS